MKARSHPLYFHLVVFIFLALSLSLLYANTYYAPFAFDDISNIYLNPSVTQSDLSWESLKNIYYMSPNKRRVLPNLSFGFNYFFGGTNVFGYHLVNIIIHIGVSLVFYLLARTTLALPGPAKDFNRSAEIAFAATLLWAIHPLQTNGVTYIVQRMTSMATLFFLLSLLCYVKARIHARVDFKKILLGGASALFGVLALLSKEISAMLPVMILGYEFFFLRQARKNSKDRKKLFLMLGGGLLLFAAICLLFLGSNPIAGILNKFNYREFTLSQRLLTETRVVFHYLALLVLPLPSRLNLAYDYPLSTGLMAPPQTLLAIIGLIGLTWLVFALYKRDRLASFAIFWFLGNLLIESSVIALEIIFEHRMYMPSMFLFLAGVAWCYRLQVTPRPGQYSQNSHICPCSPACFQHLAAEQHLEKPDYPLDRCHQQSARFAERTHQSRYCLW